jgi:thioredoxin-related protein
MRKIAILCFVLLSSFSFAQDWQTNFEEAKKIASAQDKNIILVFSGSDWCAPCIKLDKSIWHSEKEWIIVKADFPRKKANVLTKEQTEQNRKLAEKYNNDGSFPLVVVLDNTGKVLGKMGYKNVSPEEYIKMIHALEKK